MGSPSESNIVFALSDADFPASRECSAVEREVVSLFDECRDQLLRYVLSFSLDIPDAEEVIQETFLALFQHLRRDKPRQNLRGWLFRVAHNLALKKRQRELRDSKSVSQSMISAEDVIIDPGPNPEDQLTTRQTQKRLMAVLHALPEQDRRCLHLRAEGLRYREIAEILGISLGSVFLCLERSLARMARAAER